jgi:hypothetical protein
MANTFQNNPIVIDTVMVVTYLNSSPPNKLAIYPRKIYWLNPANIGDTFVINDPQGNLLFEGRCEVANQSQYFDAPVSDKWRDFIVNTLASGTLIIYFST